MGIQITPQLVSTGIALNNGGIIKSAYAIKLGQIFDKVAEIQVTPNKDYNEEYVGGTNLLNILSARYTNTAMSYYTMVKKPVLELFKELNYDGCLLSFNVPPSTSEQHIFTITISTTDGKTLSTTTDEVFLRAN